MAEPLDAGAVVDRLRQLHGVTTDRALSEAMGVPYTTISSWRTRNRAPYDECVDAVRKFRSSLDWLLLGVGAADCVRESTAAYGLPANDRMQRIGAFLAHWAASRNEDEQAWLEMQLARAVPEYAEWIAALGK